VCVAAIEAYAPLVVGLCEVVQHLSMFDYVEVSGAVDDRVIEYVDRLHEHVTEPVRIGAGHYLTPTAPACRRRCTPRA
jgi:L-fuconate dehydratase